MTNTQNDGASVRNLVASCDLRDAATVPKALFGYVASVIDPSAPSVYIIDLLPPLSTAMQSFLNGIGAFNSAPHSPGEVAGRRLRLLECLDAFIDEARLGEGSGTVKRSVGDGERS